jgi:hypothetical protein
MTLTQKTDHVSEALDNSIDFFKNKPKFAAFMTALVNQIQDIEDVSFELFLNRWLDTAVGVQLDGLGDIVGESRQGRGDDDYRLAIKARIQINFSNATPEDIYAALVNFNDRIYEFIDVYPATFMIRLVDALVSGTDPTPEEFQAFLNTINAGGVKAWFQYSEADDDNTFTFSSGDTAEASDNQGFSFDPIGPFEDGDMEQIESDGPELFTDGDMESATVDDWDTAPTNTILSKTTMDPQAGSRSLRVESDTVAVDGDMEVAGTTDWSAVNSATLSKSTTAHTGSQSLSIAHNGVANPGANPAAAPLTIGKNYRMTGWAAGDGGSVYPKIYEGTNQIWSGVLSDDWQFYSLEFEASATTFTLESVASAAGFALFDDINITEITNLMVDGDMTQTGSCALQDGDMEKTGTTDWSPQAAAILSKQGGAYKGAQCLRATYNAAANPGSYQSTLIVSNTYRIRGAARSDGNSLPRVYNPGPGDLWVGVNTHTNWQTFEATFVSAHPWIMLISYLSVSGYVEFDSVEVINETEATSNYTPSNATLTKELDGTKQILRITNTGAGTGKAEQIPLTLGANYVAVGRARSNGTAVPSLDNGAAPLWTGTTSTSWQSFSVPFTESAAGEIDLVASAAGVDEYVEFDYIHVYASGGSEQTVPTAIFNQNLAVNSKYNFTGYGRSDGLNTPRIYNGTDLLWEGTTSTSFQSFDLEFLASDTELSLTTDTIAGRCGFDTFSIKNTDLLYWIASNALLSKSTTDPRSGLQSLYVNGIGALPSASQTVITTVGDDFVLTGWARSEDGTSVPQIFNSGTAIWTGTTSTDWQYFEIEDTATGTDIEFGSSTTNGQVGYDDVSITSAVGGCISDVEG